MRDNVDRNLKIAMIAMWTVIAIILGALLIYGITSGRGSYSIFRFGHFNAGPSKIQKQESASLDSCNKISVEFSSSDITVNTTDGNEMKVVQRGAGNFSDSEKFTLSRDGDTITIKQGNSHKEFFIFGFGDIGNRIELDIPKSYAKDLEISSTSGDINVDSDINLNSLKCTQSSGDFRCNKNITADEISLNATSGDIDISNLDSKKYDINSSSGDIDIRSLSGSGKIEASSGDIKVKYSSISDYTDVSASSGDIHLTVPKSLSFEFSGKCSSGDINSDFDMNYKNKKGNEATAKVGDGPYKKINAEATSGDINISTR